MFFQRKAVTFAKINNKKISKKNYEKSTNELLTHFLLKQFLKIVPKIPFNSHVMQSTLFTLSSC